LKINEEISVLELNWRISDTHFHHGRSWDKTINDIQDYQHVKRVNRFWWMEWWLRTGHFGHCFFLSYFIALYEFSRFLLINAKCIILISIHGCMFLIYLFSYVEKKKKKYWSKIKKSCGRTMIIYEMLYYRSQFTN
jgi:hypothetical protein